MGAKYLTMDKPVFQLSTLVDITATGVIRSLSGNDLRRNQQRNYETVLQILSLRTQPHIISLPESIIYTQNPISEFGNMFGDIFKEDHHRVWNLFFTADFPEAYANEVSSVGNLLKDFEEIPIIVGLEETAKFMLPIFYPYGTIKNIHLIRWL